MTHCYLLYWKMREEVTLTITVMPQFLNDDITLILRTLGSLALGLVSDLKDVCHIQQVLDH